MRVHVHFLQPILYRRRHHFRAIVTAQARRAPVFAEQFIENTNDVACRQAAADRDLETLAGKLVHHGHALQLACVLRPIKDKIVATDVVRKLGPVDPLRGRAQHLALPALSHHLQPRRALFVQPRSPP